jgi:hypothetical protein
MCKIGGCLLEGIIDRFEEDSVVLEISEGTLSFDRELFPKEIKEGDIVEYVDNRFILKEKKTKERKNYIENLFKSLIDDDK